MDPYLEQYQRLYSEFGVDGVFPEWALVTHDCREDEVKALVGDMSGKLAIHLGEFCMPDIFALGTSEPDDIDRVYDAVVVQPDEYDDESEFNLTIPLLLTEDANLIWGIESYWGKIEQDGQSLLKQLGVTIQDLTERFRSNEVFEKFRRLFEAKRSHWQREPTDSPS